MGSKRSQLPQFRGPRVTITNSWSPEWSQPPQFRITNSWSPERSQPLQFRERMGTFANSWSPDIRSKPTTNGKTQTPPPLLLPPPPPPPPPPKLKLLRGYEDIIEDADSPIVYFSIDKLYDKLRLGPKWEEDCPKGKNSSNCFMVFARDLSITWAEDNRYWVWSYVKETSDAPIEVAELINVCWLEVHG